LFVGRIQLLRKRDILPDRLLVSARLCHRAPFRRFAVLHNLKAAAARSRSRRLVGNARLKRMTNGAIENVGTRNLATAGKASLANASVTLTFQDRFEFAPTASVDFVSLVDVMAGCVCR